MLLFTLLLEVIWILAADGGPHGPDHWPDSYPECGSNAQSPINIQTQSVTFDPELPALQPHGYDQPGTKPLELHNNGHTVQLSLPPTLHLEGFSGKYVAVQLHLHWGQKGSPGGSEHQINSEATAAELHIVHYDSDSYESLSEAAQRPQGLAVLGILIEVGETKNPAYEHILSRLHEIRHKDQKTSVPPFNVTELLPPRLEQYFRYNGSLTTPPCYQSVLWTVFNQRAQISIGQLEKLRETLFSTQEEPLTLLVQNHRVPQPLNQRIVLASFIQGRRGWVTRKVWSSPQHKPLRHRLLLDIMDATPHAYQGASKTGCRDWPDNTVGIVGRHTSFLQTTPTENNEQALA
ncbi:carbonic anhydrase 14 isoform X4 [Manis pentadactyla]|uniref:carbonic anhydrase 14 isoform X4 n=1 Tax=Manis pentadactyla TaxID=143292 RepID=UPI00255C716E|nr:carbonic anhydrase 14 isoform X4 [Manis pentadactyla]